jgi:hypothetical protein
VNLSKRYHPRLTETKGGVCVSTVSIVCGCDLPDRARADQIGTTIVVGDVIGRSRRRLS